MRKAPARGVEARQDQVTKIIPFYGAENRPLFEIERRCMDRDGLVIRRLDELLPAGLVLDVGAGDGFTAERLGRADRTVVPLEPARGMIDRERRLPWVRGVAQELPFRAGAFAGAYATWAYFFPTIGHGDAGLEELHRVVRPGGPLLLVDNAGGDEFSAWFDEPDLLASDPDWWAARGFQREIVETCFRFDTVDELHELFTLYFGERGRQATRLEIGYRVALYRSRSRGPVT
jgi:SAM-dependent methyltransferase